MPVLAELFVLWSLPFWLLLVAECAVLFWAVSCRRGFVALFSLLLFAAIIQFFGGVPILQTLWHNPLTALAALAGWLAVSVPWAFTKWWLFVTNNSNRYDEILADFRTQPGNADLPADVNDFTPEQKVDWKEYFDQHCYPDDWYEYRRVEFYPKVRDHKADVMTWMTFWPWSLLWTLLNDPVRRFFQHVYWQISAALQSISDRYWKDKAGHMPTAEELKAVYAKREQQREAQERSQGVCVDG